MPNRPNILSGEKMPFGTHKGKFLDDVPATYLKWLSEQKWIRKWPTVRAYILRNMQTIDSEVEELENDAKFFSDTESTIDDF